MTITTVIPLNLAPQRVKTIISNFLFLNPRRPHPAR